MNINRKISGFTLVRNAKILDYPFPECVESILPLCDEFIINCGDSEDNTWEICKSLEERYPKVIKVIRSIWDKNGQTGGFQLKYQTDQALAHCRGNWCFYIQADEAVHEEDFPKILTALDKAEDHPSIDGIVFDYLHFYGDYGHTIRGRNWYRKEVRLFKNRRGIGAFRDAQGFRRQDKKLLAVPSEARVFHYGYVRRPESLETKSKEMAQWWGQTPSTDAEGFKLKRHFGLTKYTGTHPMVMQNRLSKHPEFDPGQCERKWDWNEVKNAVTLAWESVVPVRLGEFRNYELIQ